MILPDELFQQLKRAAASGGVTMTHLIEAAVRSYLASIECAEGGSGYQLQWGTEKGVLCPGVVLEDRDSLFAAMEGDD